MKKIIRNPNNHYHHFSLTNPLGPIDFENEVNCIAVADDLYNYLSDSFTWINSTFPNGENCPGIDYIGVSELDINNTKKFKKIIQAWIQLFNLSNDSILLRVPDTSTDEIYISIDKADIIRVLTSLVTLCDQAISTHSGITIYGL